MKKKSDKNKKRMNRLVSLDFFRGLTIVLMILVNNQIGKAYPQLMHAEWNGWTIADTIFPFFLWIVGISMVFSFEKRIQEGYGKNELFLHLSYRSMIIFSIGLFLNLFPYFDFTSFRIMGVLQRIALVYFIAGNVLLWSKPKLKVATMSISIGLLLIVYGLIVFLAPVPGFGQGVLSKDGSIVQYVDGLFLQGHMLEKTWDPEGILSTLPAIATVLFGILIGLLLKNKVDNPRKVLVMIVFGASMIILGCIINIWFPINKNLWSSSYTIFMAGLSTLAFSLAYWIIDVKLYKRWTLPFVMCGMNAIVLYVISTISMKILFLVKVGQDTLLIVIYKSLSLIISTPANISLVFSLLSIIFIFIVATIMYRMKWFLKI